MSFIAVGIGAAAVIGGSIVSANAASSAARSQRKEAAAQRAAILGQADKNRERATALARATPQELAVLARANESALSSLDREEELLNAINPTMMEASQQALKLLRGETAGTTKVMENQRNMQRQQLVNSLRSQYGPNAETSSVGQRTLSQFDMETSSLLTNANSSAFNQVFGAATADAGARTRAANSGLQEVGQGFSRLQSRMLDTEFNLGAQTLGALSGTSQQMINTAGANQVGASLLGNAFASAGGNAMNAGLNNWAAQSTPKTTTKAGG